MSNNGGGQYSGIPSRKLNRPPDYGHFAQQALLHFLTLILILHSRSQFAFYEDLRNKSLHPTAFYFLSNQFGKSSVPGYLFLGFGVSGGSSEGNPGNVDCGGSLHVSVIGIGLVGGSRW